VEEVRPTRAVVRILKEFVDDVGDVQYGFKLMKATGFSSAKTYQILARLRSAGWIDKETDPAADVRSGGPPRVTYRMRPEAVPNARRLVQEARYEFAPAKPRTERGAVRALGWS